MRKLRHDEVDEETPSLVDHATTCDIFKVKENETKPFHKLQTLQTEKGVKLHFSKYDLSNQYLIIMRMIY